MFKDTTDAADKMDDDPCSDDDEVFHVGGWSGHEFSMATAWAAGQSG